MEKGLPGVLGREGPAPDRLVSVLPTAASQPQCPQEKPLLAGLAQVGTGYGPYSLVFWQQVLSLKELRTFRHWMRTDLS